MSEPTRSSNSSKLTAAQIRYGMRMSLWDCFFGATFYGLTFPSSVFITGLALLIGANNFEIGLLAAVGPLLSGVSIFAAWLLEKTNRRKTFYLVTVGIHRAVFFCFLILPFFAAHMHARTQVGILLGVIFFSIFFGYFQGTAWMSWMADLIPEDKRGAYFSRRNMVYNVVWMIMAYLCGRFLDAHKTLWGYNIVFCGGTIFALIAMIFLYYQPDPPMALSADRPSWRALARSALSSVQFRNFLFFQIAWGFTTSLAGPFYNVHMLQNLHIDMARITLWGIVGGIVGTVTMPYWGLLGDKAGNRSTILFGLMGSCATAFCWFLIKPDNMNWMLLLIFGLGGFFDTGVGLISFNMLLSVLPEKNKPSYLAFFEAVVGTLAGFSPALGGYLALSLPHVEIPFFALNPVLAVIAISTILRIFPMFFIFSLPEQHGRGVGFMVKEFVLTNPFRLFSNLYFVRKSPVEKINAINALSLRRSKAGIPELVHCLHDLDPRVRQRAAEALGDIRDGEAVPALLEALNDPLEEIQGEAAVSLGKIGDNRAAAPLLTKLASPDQHLQSCAATALGDLRAADAVEPLVKLMQTSQRNSVILACANALGHIGDYRTVDQLLETSRSGRAPALKRSLLACAGSLIDEDGSLYRVLSAPEQHADRAVAEILNIKTVRLAKRPHTSLLDNLQRANEAFRRKNFNEVVVELKLLNQVAVREYLAIQEVKDTMDFEEWVKLLDSEYHTQLFWVYKADAGTGIGLAIVDYYARHCPVVREPDIDNQEFMLALYAFRRGQIGLYRLVHGPNFLREKLLPGLDGLTRVLDVT
jgi:MFS family permease